MIEYNGPLRSEAKAYPKCHGCGGSAAAWGCPCPDCAEDGVPTVIVIRVPLRISFFGGGTDYPAWYGKHGGTVLGAAINKYVYVTEQGKSWCDLPTGSGLGSSSARTVGCAFIAANRSPEVPLTPLQIASVAMRLDQNVRQECVGSQDYIFAAFGGFRWIRFGPGERINVNPYPIRCFDVDRVAALHSRLMLFDTGLRREASAVASTYARTYTHWTHAVFERFRDMVERGVGLMMGKLPIDDQAAGLDEFGDLLHEAWVLKRSLSRAVSTPQIDEWYRTARAAGALGGKLCGAGGGGHLLLYVPPEKHDAVRDALPLTHVPFEFEPEGARVVADVVAV